MEPVGVENGAGDSSDLRWGMAGCLEMGTGRRSGFGETLKLPIGFRFTGRGQEAQRKGWGQRQNCGHP
jgi:hypothetical protein